ncbi:hypothetical protein C2S53_006700 [Perilla frutescens var. hirtella]|uniref:SWIM-type domain-containing protein n=1 Tax=Perilla frutescens var. hirtella TaxID=608512 RepID=A0AAD4IPW3_PERFH|nr:hypothetical protein C2S53_006700 [Perilla frutescens var. hirtella]
MQVDSIFEPEDSSIFKLQICKSTPSSSLKTAPSSSFKYASRLHLQASRMQVGSIFKASSSSISNSIFKLQASSMQVSSILKVSSSSIFKFHLKVSSMDDAPSSSSLLPQRSETEKKEKKNKKKRRRSSDVMLKDKDLRKKKWGGVPKKDEVASFHPKECAGGTGLKMDFDLNVGLELEAVEQLTDGHEDVGGSLNNAESFHKDVGKMAADNPYPNKEFESNGLEALAYMRCLEDEIEEFATDNLEDLVSKDGKRSQNVEDCKENELSPNKRHFSNVNRSRTDFEEISNNSPDQKESVEQLCQEFEKKLSIGSIVDDADKAFLLYCEYGRCKGFIVRRGGQRYIKQSNDIRWKEFKCSCNGLQVPKFIVPVYQKQVTRTNCQAKLRVSRAYGGPWKVIYFEKNHNHELLALALVVLVNLEDESGGPQNVGFIRKDAYAHIATVKKKTKVENGDANALLDFFIKKSHTEPFFYWDVQLDDDGRLMNFFFRDSRCVVDYESFGDVLSVDTTFKTNRYDLVCAPFVGINHHTNNVMFGMGFLSDETTSSFEWLFKSFLESMNGKEPQVIFTDPCQAMMNAIDTVFVKAAHRLCQWHINQNAPSHFGSLNGGLLATSRSEVTNKVLKDMCSRNSSLYEFMVYYEEIQKRWRVNEKAEDTYCIWLPGQFSMSNGLLTQAATVYTRNVYKSFEFEIANSFNVILEDNVVENGDTELIFKTSSVVDGSHRRTITFDRLSHHVSCSCRMWKREGIFCRHILKVYYVKNVMSIPSLFILKRWTKKAKLRTQVDSDRCVKSFSTGLFPFMTFVNQIMRNVHEMCSSAIDNNDAQQMILDRIDALREEVSDIVVDPCQMETDYADKNKTFSSRFQDPRSPQKRCFVSKRFVRHWECNTRKGTERGKIRAQATSKKRVRSRFLTSKHPLYRSSAMNDDTCDLPNPEISMLCLAG